MALHQRLMMKRTMPSGLRKIRGKGNLPIPNWIIIIDVRRKT